MPDELQTQFIMRRVEKAVRAALLEIDGADNEPLLADMTATLLIIHAFNATAALRGGEKALQMFVAFQADVTARLMNIIAARRELSGPLQ